MKKIFLALLVPQLLWANSHQRSEDIQKWVDVNPEKGYILSVDLHYEKMCSKIWTKQLKEFKKMNPHIKDPNMILVHQKIKVQDCRMEIKEVEPEVAQEIIKKEEPQKPKPKWFIGAFGGGALIGGKSGDTSKSGYNLGIKIGQKIPMKNKQLSLAVGYMFNEIETRDRNNSLGAYEVRTEMLTAEASLLSKISEKVELGPRLLMLAGKDVSFTEEQDGRQFGLYLGAESLYKLSDKWDIELNLQQKIDDLSRINMLGNIGLRLSF